jgi:hypothetical protein
VFGFKYFVLKKSGIKIEGEILKCLKFRDQGMKILALLIALLLDCV